MIDLENPSKTCNSLEDYPVEDCILAVGFIDGTIKSCGSGFDSVNCYDYESATNSWITSPSLNIARDSPRSSFIDGVWLVSGDIDVDTWSTTDMWTGTGFDLGPQLPIGMFMPCQLTINSTHVFFADMYDTGDAFLLDWYAQTTINLPPMTGDLGFWSCGLINNPENGIEVVIVEDGVTEIFNFRDEAWRTGPTVDSFHLASYAQIGDTFVVFGGELDDDTELDTFYKFDHINYELILMSQRLQVPRSFSPGVVAVPDDFVTCS